MSTHKQFDRICALAVALCLLTTLLLYSVPQSGARAASAELGYETRLFSTDRVHTLDIAIDDWEGFLSTAQSEEYTACDVTVDGEIFRDVGIRGKGNTSLSQVSSMDSQRYSFKVEFDQYDSSRSYHGLDKLCLNNLIQDNTLMKDYLTYQMMLAFDAAAPLCSFVWVTVNGEDWGLYLAVEAIEDSFLRRNYGSDHGQLYKPDSMNMGGGRGNGRDFDMKDWQEQQENGSAEPFAPTQAFPGGRGGTRGQPGEMPVMPENFDPALRFGGGKGGFGGGMGSSDVKLQYIDGDPDSYANIFDNAKTEITDADKTRLIQSLEALGRLDGSAVDVEAVIRYFVVHNFVVNGDSYTGNMVHNYYLYEDSGLLSMVPWDYNLAYGGFQGGSAASSVNDDIDAPLSCTGNGDRPMMDWLLQSDEHTELYHRFFTAFLDTVDPQAIIDQAYGLIAPYVERDPTKFCTYEAFETGVGALKTFCDLRVQSVRAQLSGDDTSIDTAGLDLSAMGSMNMGGGFDRDNRGQREKTGIAPQMPAFRQDAQQQTAAPSFPQPDVAAPASAGILQTVIWAVVLLAGLLVAFLYKR
ncbi:MAG: CotH kinase family protein [Clostridia bacterium]|nr:CotH kinase family protein [Clostridia bacterium]